MRSHLARKIKLLLQHHCKIPVLLTGTDHQQTPREEQQYNNTAAAAVWWLHTAEIIQFI